eukprot:8888515-Pyramimonas_sp.AAC.1
MRLEEEAEENEEDGEEENDEDGEDEDFTSSLLPGPTYGSGGPLLTRSRGKGGGKQGRPPPPVGADPSVVLGGAVPPPPEWNEATTVMMRNLGGERGGEVLGVFGFEVQGFRASSSSLGGLPASGCPAAAVPRRGRSWGCPDRPERPPESRVVTEKNTRRPRRLGSPFSF